MTNKKVVDERPYKICTAMSLLQMVDNVNYLAERGYKPIGGVDKTENNVYYQVMYREPKQ